MGGERMTRSTNVTKLLCNQFEENSIDSTKSDLLICTNAGEMIFNNTIEMSSGKKT